MVTFGFKIAEQASKLSRKLKSIESILEKRSISFDFCVFKRKKNIDPENGWGHSCLLKKNHPPLN